MIEKFETIEGIASDVRQVRTSVSFIVRLLQCMNGVD